MFAAKATAHDVTASRFPEGGLEPGWRIKQLRGGEGRGGGSESPPSPNKVAMLRGFNFFGKKTCFYHFFAQESQRGVQVGRLVGQQAVGVVPAAAQVVLDHGFLHVHPLHFSPGAAARVQQAAQALGQRGQTLDAGHPPESTVGGFTVHRRAETVRPVFPPTKNTSVVKARRVGRTEAASVSPAQTHRAAAALSLPRGPGSDATSRRRKPARSTSGG